MERHLAPLRDAEENGVFAKSEWVFRGIPVGAFPRVVAGTRRLLSLHRSDRGTERAGVDSLERSSLLRHHDQVLPLPALRVEGVLPLRRRWDGG